MYNKTKTQAAWVSANKFIKNLNLGTTYGGNGTAIIADLKTRISNLAETAQYFSALADLATSAGLVSQTFTPGDIITTWLASGIPWEVWAGKLMYDTYSKSTSASGKPVYKADHAQAVALFSEQLRDVFRTARLMLRVAEDVKNVDTAKHGNPGGVADDDKHTH